MVLLIGWSGGGGGMVEVSWPGGGGGLVLLVVTTPSGMGFSQTKNLGAMLAARLADQAVEP